MGPNENRTATKRTAEGMAETAGNDGRPQTTHPRGKTRPRGRGQPNKLDRDALHAYLWKQANSRGLLRLNQGKLAEELQVQRSFVVRLMKEFLLEGRAKKVQTGRNILYEIKDPEGWKWERGPR